VGSNVGDEFATKVAESLEEGSFAGATKTQSYQDAGLKYVAFSSGHMFAIGRKEHATCI
jgi:hypothetical protein